MMYVRCILAAMLLTLPSLLPAKPLDARSGPILNALATSYRSYTSFSAEVRTYMVQEGTQNPPLQTGKVQYQGNKYRVTLPGMELICDGQKIYQYLPQVKEVNVSLVSQGDPGGSLLMSSPMEFIARSTRDFDTRLLKTYQEAGRNMLELELTPASGASPSVESASSNITKVVLKVDQQRIQVLSMNALMQNGVRFYVEFSRIQVNLPIKDTEFLFRPQDHPGVEVIDLTY
jgi:outer membrane lipoprotein-sorting protein